MDYYLGIDPGQKGGISLIDTYKNIQICREIPYKTNRHGKLEIDTEIMQKLIQQLPNSTLAVVEDVAARPSNGVSSMFRFGYDAGVLFGMLSQKPIRVVKIKPAVWKARLGLTRTKRESIDRAINEFGHLFITDGPAEAALLALYGLLFLKGNTTK